jgi:hypothetical protein
MESLVVLIVHVPFRCGYFLQPPILRADRPNAGNSVLDNVVVLTLPNGLYCLSESIPLCPNVAVQVHTRRIQLLILHQGCEGSPVDLFDSLAPMDIECRGLRNTIKLAYTPNNNEIAEVKESVLVNIMHCTHPRIVRITKHHQRDLNRSIGSCPGLA